MFGGSAYKAMQEIKGILPRGGRITNYLSKRNAKNELRTEFKDSKENEKQGDTLEDILKELKKGGRGGSFSLGKGMLGKTLLGGGVIGGLGLLIKKILNPKTLLGKLSIPVLIWSIIDASSDAIKKVADSIGVDVANIGIAGKIQGIANMIGEKTIGFTNDILKFFDVDYQIDPQKTEKATAKLRESITTASKNFEENYPRFGKAVISLFSTANNVLGKGTTALENYVSKAFKVVSRAFDKQTKEEREFIKAQDIVREHDKYGLHSKQDRDNAFKKMGDLSETLLKNKEFVSNSPYLEIAKQANLHKQSRDNEEWYNRDKKISEEIALKREQLKSNEKKISQLKEDLNKPKDKDDQKKLSIQLDAFKMSTKNLKDALEGLLMLRSSYDTPSNIGNNTPSPITTTPASPASPSTLSSKEGGLKILEEAKKDIGVKEVKGWKSNPKIMGYLYSTSYKNAKDDSGSANAWCSAFINKKVIDSGYSGTNSASAGSWRGWGVKASPQKGAIAVKSRYNKGRKVGNHVVVVESIDSDKGTMTVIGGNQGDKVSRKTVKISSFDTFRMPSEKLKQNSIALKHKVQKNIHQSKAIDRTKQKTNETNKTNKANKDDTKTDGTKEVKIIAELDAALKQHLEIIAKNTTPPRQKKEKKNKEIISVNIIHKSTDTTIGSKV